MKADWIKLEEYQGDVCGKMVYAAEFEGAIKIGVSVDPVQRLNTIRTSSGRKLIDAYVLWAPDPYVAIAAEAYLHGLHASKRLEGEWFSVSLQGVVKGSLEVTPCNEASGLNKPMSDGQRELGYSLVMVATAEQVLSAQEYSATAAIIPTIGYVFGCISKASEALGRSFEIEPNTTTADAIRAYVAFLEQAEQAGFDTGMNGDELQRIVENSCYYTKAQFKEGLA
ncbi:GIY-YIG nuclease family protein [Ruegeria jejuensis]|uniref:GIY-YIG nuclease family protein n=1 Tax=Ruegeria jejuensis TaxID=3233338 RepID=UPI00355C6E90